MTISDSGYANHSVTFVSMSRALDRSLHNILHSAELPTLPVVASKVLELTSLEEVDLSMVINLIAQDISLSTKILKVANSAFYNFPQQISSVQQAVSLLGINAVRSLVLSFTFLSMGQDSQYTYFDLNEFWKRSLLAAAAARLIGEHLGEVDPEEVFTLGLLQNIGQLIFALTLPTRYDTLLQEIQTGNSTAVDILEEEYLGLPHTIAGAEVAKAWGLPETIIQAIRYHHTPLECDEANHRQSLAVKVVYLSEMISQIYASNAPIEARKEFEEQARTILGLSHADIRRILAVVDQKVMKSAQFFGIDMEQVRPVSEIIQEANIRLSILHLSYEEMNRELQQAKKSLEELSAQLVERNIQLEQLANIDGLTEIHNHRYFQTFLRTELRRSKENNLPLTLLLADIDYFKQFNDQHGHQTGDFILKELCRTVLPILRDYDLMARYGGEEFAIVLPETNTHGALAVAQKICSTISSHSFSDGNACYQVTMSIGAATVLPAQAATTASAFIEQADQALYEAKNRGRNQSVLYQNKGPSKWLSL